MKLAKRIVKAVTASPTKAPQAQTSPTQSSPLPLPPALPEQNQINNDTEFINNIDHCFLQAIAPQDILLDIDSSTKLRESLGNLAKIVEDFKKAAAEQETCRQQYTDLKQKIGNHHSIVANMESMYEQKIRDMLDAHRLQTNALRKQLEERELVVAGIQETKVVFQSKITSLQQVNSSLRLEVNQLQKQNSSLNEMIEWMKKEAISYQAALNAVSISSKELKPSQFVEILLQSEIAQTFVKYLGFGQIKNLKLVSKRINSVVNSNRVICEHLVAQSQRTVALQRKQLAKQLQQYESIIDVFPIQNVRMAALKYIYFKGRPGDYMLDLFSQVDPSLMKKKPEPQVEQRPRKLSNFLGGFFAQKPQEQPNKVYLKDLLNQEHLKKVESKIQEQFEGILQIQSSNTLQEFRQTMNDRFKQLRQTLSQGDQISKMYSYSRYLYIEAQELHKLLHFLFGQLFKNVRNQKIIESELQDLREKHQSTKNVIQTLAAEKRAMEETNWKLEIDYTRYRSENVSLTEKLTQTQNTLNQTQSEFQKLQTKLSALETKYQETHRRCRHFEKQINSVHSLLTNQT